MNPLSLKTANEIKDRAMKAGFPAFVIHFGHVENFYAVQVVKENAAEPVGMSFAFGSQPIIGGILITASDRIED